MKLIVVNFSAVPKTQNVPEIVVVVVVVAARLAECTSLAVCPQRSSLLGGAQAASFV